MVKNPKNSREKNVFHNKKWWKTPKIREKKMSFNQWEKAEAFQSLFIATRSFEFPLIRQTTITLRILDRTINLLHCTFGRRPALELPIEGELTLHQFRLGFPTRDQGQGLDLGSQHTQRKIFNVDRSVFLNKFAGTILFISNPPLDSCFPSSTELLLIVSIGKFDNQIFISCSESFY